MGIFSKSVKDIMTSEVEAIHPDSSLMEAAMKMKSLDVGVIPVVNGKRLDGVITDRDIAIRAVAEGLNPTTTKVRDVMTKDVVTTHPGTSVKDAANLMKDKQIRRLMIVDNDDHLCGVVSLGDMAVDYADDKLSGAVLKDVSEPSSPKG